MFVPVGLRSARASLNGPWQSMLLFVVVSAVVLVFAGLILIPLESNGYALYAGIGVNNCYRVAKRYFLSGNGSSGSGNGGGSNNGQGTDILSGQFSYKTAVAYQPKDRDDPIYRKLKTSVSSPTGEDNFFVAVNGPHDVYAGIADGVGGWAEHGYDSSAISRELCNAIGEYSSMLGTVKNGFDVYTPKSLIQKGYDKIRKDEIVKVGGTTSLVAHFRSNGILEVANLGDSWCGVFRENRLIFQTKFQTVGFNAPYQLAVIPKDLLEKAKRSGSSYIQNPPSDADEYVFQLAKGDVVMLVTDGVTDNIGYQDMELFWGDHKKEVEMNLQQVSKKFVDNVVKLSKDPNYPSVFAQEISKLSGKTYTGGKEDDITLVVVTVN